MRFKFDENIPADFRPEWLLMDCDTVVQEGLSGADDETVFGAAQGANRFLITQDLDFSDIRRYLPGTHAGILLLRLRDPSRRQLVERLETIFRLEDVASWDKCFVVATESKIRVRRPK